ncbi:MAG: hypothetical protein BJ554DRAFT_182 [Olpidium bornovanus]|uniref:RRM domain-containing protein n=1 Tax=Olpidium bornovanus TaxID=278681 RepID=A0A8H7ZTW4_9FUNG|nr:MAG: hypothetical protein BJ554DRAFT_182 [Olpidium bornovanus]
MCVLSGLPRDAGISLSERELGGRKLLIKDAKSFEGRPSLQAATPSSASGASGGGGSIGKRKVSTTLFIGNLSFGTTEDSVHRYFAKCEGLRKVRMPTFEDSGNCKGCATKLLIGMARADDALWLREHG